MKLSLFVDPQEGLSYDVISRTAVEAERLGFHGFYRSDHLTSTAGRFERPATEAWTTLAGVARETSRIRLGTLITPIGFRSPSLYAKIINTVDEMSGGRVDVSLGTGWYGPEHELLGFDFPAIGERFDRLEEYLQAMASLWADAPEGFTGQHYRVEPIAIAPRSVQRPRPWMIIGGHGPRRTPALAARYADEFNIDWPSPEKAAALFANFDEACAVEGRDPGAVVKSVLLGAVVAADENGVEEAFTRAAGFLGLADAAQWREENTDGWTVGTAEAVATRLREYRAVGVQHVMLMLAPGDDLEMIRLVAERVMPGLQD